MGGQVFADTNNDGLISPSLGEAGLPGVEVFLLRDDGDSTPNGSDTSVASVTTGGNGKFVFDGLAEGKYWAAILSDSFLPGTSWHQWQSSLGQRLAPSPDNDVDGDDNGTPIDLGHSAPPAVISGVIELRPGTEPTTDGDDANGNLTLDFGLVPPPDTVSVGNLVFMDTDGDGRFEPELGEMGLDGVIVYLFRDLGDGVPNRQDTFVGERTTSGGGRYLFSGLPEGRYWLGILGYEFLTGQLWRGWVSSAGRAAPTDPNDDVDGDNNGAEMAIFGWGPSDIVSSLVELTRNTEPTGDGDGANGNLTVDFGLVPPQFVSLGGQVFKDNNNDGMFDPEAGESAISGMMVLVMEDDGNGVAGASDTIARPAVLTDAGGRFTFDVLPEGDYWIWVPSFQFLSGFPWFAWTSSLGNSPAPDPDTDIDGDDNGSPLNISGRPRPDIATGLVRLRAGTEPVSDGDDANGNHTVDIGLAPPRSMSFGGQVFEDRNDNGVFEPTQGDSTVPGVAVYLLRDGGNWIPDNRDPLAGQASTGFDGSYLFTGLEPGQYWVSISGYQFMESGRLSGWESCFGFRQAPDPNDDIDNDDNGTPINISGWGEPDVISGIVELIPGAEPTQDGDDADGNRTIDLGLVAPQLVNVGGHVWDDQDGDGLFEPEAGELGLAGGLIYLLTDNGNGVPDASDRAIGSTEIASDGSYDFRLLPEGNYWVSLSGYQFMTGGRFFGWGSSRGDEGAPDPDNDVDGDDNGAPVNISGWGESDVISQVIELRLRGEPTLDGDGPDGNRTLDLGLIRMPPVTLGGIVFHDTNDNSRFDPNSGEVGFSKVVVYLLRDNGDGIPNAGDLAVANATTTSNGSYRFESISQGFYWVSISGYQFLPSGTLFGWSSSGGEAPAPDPDNNVPGDDNGAPKNISGYARPDVTSQIIELRSGTEPTTDGDGSDGNLTLDFGLVQTRGVLLGGTVFKDTDDDGHTGDPASEPGLVGALLYLLRDNGNGIPDPTDAVAGLAVTDEAGKYQFDRLTDGEYWIALPASQFTEGALWYGWVSSRGSTVAVDPDDDVDGDDNGTPFPTDKPFGANIVSGIIDLRSGSEPVNDGDGPDSNRTLDFGLVPP